MTPNQLPPLPEPDTHCFDDDTGKDVWSYTADQMHAYALAVLAQQAQECTRSHPHELMSPMCGLRTEIARLTNENERLKRAQQAQPVHQFRRQLCADWYDGHPDHEDGGGPYETRILYTTPPAPQPAPVDEREAFERWCGPFSELRRSDFDPGRYCHSGVSLAWDAWQARAALQSPAPQTKVQP